jgi:hypothetical protein
MVRRRGTIDSYKHAEKVWDQIYEQHRQKPDVPILVYQTTATGNLVRLREDLHRYRGFLRARNSQIFPKGHPSYGTCIFDPFVVSLTEDSNGTPILKIWIRTSKGYEVTVEEAS